MNRGHESGSSTHTFRRDNHGQQWQLNTHTPPLLDLMLAGADRAGFVAQSNNAHLFVQLQVHVSRQQRGLSRSRHNAEESLYSMGRGQAAESKYPSRCLCRAGV